MLELQDDSEVLDSDLVYRRADWDKIGGIGRAAPGKAAKISANFFSDYPAEVAARHGFSDACMSIGLGSVLRRLGMEPSAILEGYPGFGLLVTTAGELRELKRGTGEPCPQGVLASPTDAEPWHGVVFDLEVRPRRDAVRKAIARINTWEIPLVGPTE